MADAGGGPAPVRIGVLDDLADGPPGLTGMEWWLRACADELRAAGRLDRDVEVVAAYGLGLPQGTAAAVERAFVELVDQDVLLVVGPAVGDNALVAAPVAERLRCPSINWAGTERARGHYGFHLQVGSHEDESIVLARHLAATGRARVGVVHDRSPIGVRHLAFLQDEADAQDVTLVAVRSVSPMATDAAAEVDDVLAARPDALVYLGLGLSAPAVARALAAARSGVPAFMNTAGIRGHQPDFARQIDGWCYLDMYADANPTLASVLERDDLPTTNPFAVAKGYDLARLAVEGVARAPELTRDGVVEGLEAVKWLPAAEGQPRTLLGFGHCDRGALHGEYLVLRQWRDGASVEVGAG